MVPIINPLLLTLRVLFPLLLFVSLICIGWTSQSAEELSPEEAVTWIQKELTKKGLKELKITYGGVLNSTEHNIFIEFGARGRSIEEGVDIVYEAALIIGRLHMTSKEPTFRINTLRFMKNGKLVSWIHSRYCAQAVYDPMIQSSFEREQFILSKLQHER